MINTTTDILNVTEATGTSEPADGYDLPVFGLDNGKFLYVHITALSCISISVAFTIFVLTSSFRKSSTAFFCKTKSERLIVYMAVCDGLFNLAHSCDHLHIFITKDHVKPRGLCVFYAFMIGEFVSAQMFMVNLVAINVFCMMFMGKDLSFGKYDWKLLLYTFGIPFIVYLVSAILGKLGPTGAFCHFDVIKGKDMYVYYLTALVLTVVFMNSLLYVGTWIKLYKESKELTNVLGESARSRRVMVHIARNLSLFVLVFCIQWYSLAAFGIAGMLGYIPDVVLYLAISFNNLGGLLNGVVFLMITMRSKAPETKPSNVSLKLGSSRCDLHV